MSTEEPYDEPLHVLYDAPGKIDESWDTAAQRSMLSSRISMILSAKEQRCSLEMRGSRQVKFSISRPLSVETRRFISPQTADDTEKPIFSME
jgi:hypothetical protein